MYTLRTIFFPQVHRLRALVLLKQFVELGHWAVDAALLVGIFPYVLKLMTHHQLVREQLVRHMRERGREKVKVGGGRVGQGRAERHTGTQRGGQRVRSMGLLGWFQQGLVQNHIVRLML